MKIGVKLPHTGPLTSADAIRRVALETERLGFDSVWVRDSLTRTVDDVKAHFTAGSIDAWDNVPEPVRPDLYESVTTLSYVAGLTERIEVGTAILIAPLRHPVWLAKYLATLDQLSGGRVVLGLGTGSPPYAKAELGALGRPELMGRRGRQMDEWLTIMRRVWHEDSVDFDGEFITITDAQIFPKPVQDPLPIIYGGTGDKVMRRIARELDGWLPIFLAPEEIRKGRALLDELTDEYGRASSDVGIFSEHWLSIDDDGARAQQRLETIQSNLFDYAKKLLDPSKLTAAHNAYFEMKQQSLVGTPDDVAELVREYEEAGVTTLILRVIADDVDEMIDQMVRFKEQVRDQIKSESVA